jgi:hypothetical protein
MNDFLFRNRTTPVKLILPLHKAHNLVALIRRSVDAELYEPEVLASLEETADAIVAQLASAIPEYTDCLAELARKAREGS